MLGYVMPASARDGGIYWLLNNDTVVDPESLSHIADKFLRDPGCGMVGATIYHYYDPLVIQYSCGATANHWLATVSPIVTPRARNQSRTDFELAIESRLDYVSGACLAITPDFLDRAGFMDEGYFLYYEELDWAARIPPHLHIGYAADAIVYHKEGAAIGGKTKGPSRKSLVADRYAARNRVLFTRRWKPSALPVVLTVNCVGSGLENGAWKIYECRFSNKRGLLRGFLYDRKRERQGESDNSARKEMVAAFTLLRVSLSREELLSRSAFTP